MNEALAIFGCAALGISALCLVGFCFTSAKNQLTRQKTNKPRVFVYGCNKDQIKEATEYLEIIGYDVIVCDEVMRRNIEILSDPHLQAVYFIEDDDLLHRIANTLGLAIFTNGDPMERIKSTF